MVRTLPLAVLFVFLTAASAFADTLRGRVVDSGQQPVVAATVIVLRGGSVVATTATSADGTFGPLTLPAGEYDVVAAAPGLGAAPKRARPAAGVGADVTIVLSAAVRSEAVVVSASAVDRPLSRLTDSVALIDRGDLEWRQVETATEALRLVPGFSLVSSGGRGALTSLFPRGGESDYTLVLVDGLATNAFGGGIDAAHVAATGVDRIEVVRGPQSAVFGSGAIGGVVNVVTRRAGPPRAGGRIEFGGQGSSLIAADASGGAGAWSWGTAIERLRSDGDTSFRPSIGRRVTNDDYERISATAGLAWSDRATRRVRVDARFGRDERGNPGPYGSDPFGLYFGLDTVSRGINHPRGLSGSVVLGDASRVRHTVQAGWFELSSRYASPFGDSEDRVRRTSGRYQADAERDLVGLSAGIELIGERADNTFVTGSRFQPVPVRRSITGLFAESRWDLGPRAALTAGVRAERIARAALEGNPGIFGPRPPFGTDVVWSANPKVSAVWYLRGTTGSAAQSGWTRLRAGAGTGIKPPTVFEIAFTDNPSLGPERSRSADVGLEHVFAGGRALVDLTAFVNRYDDLIVAVSPAWNTFSPFRTDNLANASARGLEIGVRWIAAGGFEARAAYTLLGTEILAVDRTIDKAPAPYEVGQALIRRPRHQGALDLRYTRGRAQVFLAVHGRGRMLDLEPNFASAVLANPGFTVLSVGGSIALTPRLHAYARVTNLFDRVYEEALGYPAQARSVSAGLRAAVGR